MSRPHNQPTVLYNEFDPFKAAWLRRLIAADLIPAGVVDERSIKELEPHDLQGFTHVHLFAGIGGWAYAARLAGWPADRPLWTASCPCQPFSETGQRRGFEDPRHLWPDVFRLARRVRPLVLMGEQVARKDGYGWLDGVRADLASENYASRAVDIPALAVDAPTIRQRLYWLAVADAEGVSGGAGLREDDAQRDRAFIANRDGAGCLGNAEGAGPQGIAHPERLQGYPHGGADAQRADGGNRRSFWADAAWIECHDAKARRLPEPGFPLLAHGISERVGLWAGFGDAICAPLAAEVMAAFLDTHP